MTSLPIAANLPWAMYLPIVALIAGFGLVSAYAGVARNRDDNERAERLGDIAFLLVLLGAAYAVVLLIASAVSYPSRFGDMILIVFMVVAFFGLLLFVFFFIGEMLPRRLRRRQR
jgi:hypothetical protein